jgi:EAL domain-containing protein (putative c-di-GMP-specific phosphodiesterase class I)
MSPRPAALQEIALTARAHAPAATPQHALVERLTRRHFSASPLSIGDSGAVIAQFYRSRITSAFQPLVRSRDRAVVGHHALLRVETGRGESVAPWSLFAQASSDETLVRLDRLCRTVHALNYFQSASPTAMLFLNVDSRLITGVAADHGAFFEAVLALIGVNPARVAIVMPPDAIDDPVSFVRAAISYRIRGYRVLVPVRSIVDAELSHVFLADPHYVSVDAAQALQGRPVRRFLESLAQRGTRLVARGIESGEHEALARSAGVELLQGFHMGPAMATL